MAIQPGNTSFVPGDLLTAQQYNVTHNTVNKLAIEDNSRVVYPGSFPPANIATGHWVIAALAGNYSNYPGITSVSVQSPSVLVYDSSINEWDVYPLAGVGTNGIGIYNATVQYKENDLVIYNDIDSVLPEYRTEYIYRSTTVAFPDQSPESVPSKWVRQGLFIDTDSIYAFIGSLDARLTAAELELTTKLDNSLLAVPNGIATLDASGKVNSSQLPSLVINDTYIVNSEAEMLNLAAVKGDVAVRVDIEKTFILSAVPSSDINNWVEILASYDRVISVNGLGGVVTLTTSNIPEGSNLYYSDLRVSNNTNVLANTTKRHDQVTIGTSNGLVLNGQEISLQKAGIADSGALSSEDWLTFNNKQDTLLQGPIDSYYRGDKSWQTLNTAAVVETANLYFTQSRVLNTPIGNFIEIDVVITAGDSIATALNKLQTQVNNRIATVSKAQIEAVLTGNITSHTHDIYLTDAPVDTKYYARKDGSWSEFIAEAPILEHDKLTEASRFLPEQHPQSSIIGLTDRLSDIESGHSADINWLNDKKLDADFSLYDANTIEDTDLVAIRKGTINYKASILDLKNEFAGGTTSHNELTPESRALPDQHPISSITSLSSELSDIEQDVIDEGIIRHTTDTSLQNQIFAIQENSPVQEIRYLTNELAVLNGETFRQSKAVKEDLPLVEITTSISAQSKAAAQTIASWVGIANISELQLIKQITQLFIKARKTTTGTVTMFAEFYDYTADGVKTLKGVSSEAVLTTASAGYDMFFPIEPYLAAIGSRGLIVIKGWRTGGGGGTQMILSIQGDYYSRWSYTLPVGALSSFDDKIISTQALPSLDLSSGVTQKDINDAQNTLNIQLKVTSAKSVPFSTAIPFNTVMTSMPLTVSNVERVFSPITSGAVAGARTVVVMQANGNILHVPGFDLLFKQSPDSMIWDNTNLVQNTIEFWYDGTTYWYKIVREVSNIAYKSDVIVKGAGTIYSPINDYDPATKKYTDDTVKNYVANYYPGSPNPPDDEGLGWYGVEWDEGRPNTGCIRIGSLSSFVGGGAYGLTGYPVSTRPLSNVPNDLLFVHNKMKRCLVLDNVTRNYYLDSNNSYNREGIVPSIFGTSEVASRTVVTSTGTFTAIADNLIGRYIHNTTNGKTMIYCKITGKTNDNTVAISDPRNGLTTNLFEIGDTFEVCTARLDGVDGQVMVEIPRIYYFQNYLPSDTGNLDTYKIRCGVSLYPYSGFTLHPAFIDSGQEKQYLYIGAFEAYTLSGKLTSLPDYISTALKTRATFRAEATARGSDWSQVLMYQHWLLQMLFYTEYADLNSQYRIPDTTIAYNNRAKTGRSLNNGNNSVSMRINEVLDANLTTANFETDIVGMSYRGVENFYGNMWKFLDGINLFDRRLYVSNNRISLADDTSTNYEDTGCDLPNASGGYYNKLFPKSGGFVPRKIGGSSNSVYADGLWTTTGWSVGLCGGYSANGVFSGVGSLVLYHASALTYALICSRFACSK